MSAKEIFARYEKLLDSIEEKDPQKKIPNALSMNRKTFNTLAARFKIPDDDTERYIFGIQIYIDDKIRDGIVIKWFNEKDFLKTI